MINLKVNEVFLTDKGIRCTVISAAPSLDYCIEYGTNYGKTRHLFLHRESGSIYSISDPSCTIDTYTPTTRWGTYSVAPPPLPIGLPWFTPPSLDWTKEWADILDKPKRSVCDCGGYKTYNSYAKEFHSHWCSCIKETA
jgi:hypothetical protein